MRADKPEVGHWYKSKSMPCIFEVIDNDPYENLIEVQLFSGEVERLNQEIWEDLSINEVRNPEYWEENMELSRDDVIDIIDMLHDNDMDDADLLCIFDDDEG